MITDEESLKRSLECVNKVLEKNDRERAKERKVFEFDQTTDKPCLWCNKLTNSKSRYCSDHCKEEHRQYRAVEQMREQEKENARWAK